ncbi:hypothetical protein ATK17_1892 [Branchiibius hedensis]|uniref:DUF559 domain-containing protein n=1 Tax=Branchiibius hedensis TaxID=672460 RepID=A0A2Y8ZTI2_9MICO|nr:hypothetical protein [Branchiibius hedensis]PWJ25755.1 hypothetical protein ATK17_1892 [Branchiibius hedensis]SSA34568.1 hypothetical protein SAMN04489750_1892 [Branchiibius hedensis]
MSTVPDAPFSTASGLQAGYTYRQLTGPRFVSVHRRRGIWDVPAASRTLLELLAADRLVLPSQAAISHLTGLALYGLEVDPGPRRHWSTSHQETSRLRSIVLHRRQSLGEVRQIEGLPVLCAARCLADVAPHVSIVWLVGAGDALIHSGVLTIGELREFANGSFHGSQRLRQAVRLMRERSASFRESGTRLIMACSGLPEPELNVRLYDACGAFVGKPDFLWRKQSVFAEYDGWYHERDADQRDYDIHRMERLRRLRLEPVTLTSSDYARPVMLSQRLWQAFAAQGFGGERPLFDLRQWQSWSTPPRGRRDPRRAETPPPRLLQRNSPEPDAPR